ncbi:MAG TPA: ABC-F family ATP-binding cassette domain-containing protein [Caulobacteraceae bacterium]|jgi:ATPase subunit of ABC transporter with duplicated ATPase domains
MSLASYALITLDGLNQSSPDGRVLFENLTLAFGREKTGLVGRNGVGKTTLLRVILGEQAPAAGVVSVSGRVAILRQQPSLPADATLADLLGVAEPLARLARIEAGEGRAGDLEDADWDLPQRIEAALAEIALSDVALDRRADTLSGGQATRAALAALLIEAPDFLLMDEPTNNLDAEGREAVVRMLERWRGGALVVSHDRALLRRMDRIVELTSLGANVYGGDYDLYAARKAEEEAAAQRGLDRAEQATARTQRDIQAARERKARADAAGRRSRARNDMPKLMLNARAERAETTGQRLTAIADRQRVDAERDLAEAQARIERVRRVAFELPPSGLPEGKTVLAFEGVSFAWPDGAAVLNGVSFRLVGPERMSVTGPNGSGKTTLIRLATGALAPIAGTIRRGVPAVLLDQRAALLNDDETLLQNFRRLNPEADDNTAHAALARFVFRNVSALKPAGALSGGERLRAALACALMAVRPPQLIILDEPTNHLDLDSIEAVEAALLAYDGALLVVSHDRDFLAAIGISRELSLA